MRLSIVMLLSCLLLTGCATPLYLLKQGVGQLSLRLRGTPNAEVLKDPAVSEEIKFKLRLIEDAKRFFEATFSHEGGGIYSKTIFLDEKAVSWLVIASKPTEIEAIEHRFPIVGSFPYLGFYSKDDAQAFARKLEEEELVTWMRPVYAYSTLGYLEDRVLSSFFEYDEVELVELIFHEMFHTLFFIKDEVELNENLASFFADKLLGLYYQDRPELKAYRRRVAAGEALNREIVQLVTDLRGEFQKMRPYLTVERANEMSSRLVRELLLPLVRAYCDTHALERCSDKEEDWNQARFAAIMSYESEQEFLAELYKSRAHPVEFLGALRKWYNEWKKSSQTDDFTTYLHQKAEQALP